MKKGTWVLVTFVLVCMSLVGGAIWLNEYYANKKIEAIRAETARVEWESDMLDKLTPEQRLQVYSGMAKVYYHYSPGTGTGYLVYKEPKAIYADPDTAESRIEYSEPKIIYADPDTVR